MSVTAEVPRRPERAELNVRESVTQLTPDALAKLRAAFKAFKDIRDNRGYQFFAGWHGVPFNLCQHHNEVFLPWHRGYLYHIELALQEAANDGSVTLAWWDWMTEDTIPDAYTAESVDGDENPLFDATIEPFGIPPRPDWPQRTHRDQPGTPVPDPGPVPPPLGQFNDWLMAAPSYVEFNRRNWMLHDNMHGWVGGEMGDPNWAAYDPLFWAHHTMVDRLWRVWQHNNPGGLPPESLLDRTLTYGRSPSFTVREVLDSSSLGVEYAGLVSSVPGPG